MFCPKQYTKLNIFKIKSNIIAEKLNPVSSRVVSHHTQRPCRYLNFVSELFDLIDGGIVLIGELPQLLLAPLRHLLQVGALVLRVTE